MSQKEDPGDGGNAFGHLNAQLIANSIGARLIGKASNEADWCGRRIIIKSAARATMSVGVTQNVLARVKLVVGALQNGDGSFDIRVIPVKHFEHFAYQSRSTGPTASRTRMLQRKHFYDPGVSVGYENLAGLQAQDDEETGRNLGSSETGPDQPVDRFTTTANHKGGLMEMLLRHAEIQTVLSQRLEIAFPGAKITNEFKTSNGTRVDTALHHQGQLWFYEIKTANTARECIRQAIGQLLEYSHWPGSSSASQLIVIGEPTLDQDSKDYLKVLSETYCLPLSYQQISM